MTNPDPIVRATIASSAELGKFSSALLLLRTCAVLGGVGIDTIIRRYGRDLPIFDALARRGIMHNRVAGVLDDIVDDIGLHLADGITDVVCTAMEAELLDRLVSQHPDLRFTVVRHDPSADIARVAGNFKRNFEFVDAHEIDKWASPVTTVLIVPVFDAGSEAYVTTYPNTPRIVGPDTVSKFAEVVAVDLLGSRFHYRPADLVRVSVRQFTQVVHIPVTGTFSIAKYEVIAA